LKNVIFIVNNGICERAAGWKDYDTSVFNSNDGNIRIGKQTILDGATVVQQGINSGVRVYNIRCYDKALTVTNAYNNFVYDSENKEKIALKNDIYKTGEIDIERC